MNRTGLAWPAAVGPADVNVRDCVELATRLGT
jgi:hypothetical protein